MDYRAREVWLQKAVSKLRTGLFKQVGLDVPPVRVSVGFPSRRVGKAIGQHWGPAASSDKKDSIFICPTVENPLGANGVLGTLVHELVHAVVGPQAKHGPDFKNAAWKVGLTGKMTETVPGPTLERHLRKLSKDLGKYPHRALNLDKNPVKKQTTRMLKMECGECGYIARASNKCIEEHGPVLCPCNREKMEVASE